MIPTNPSIAMAMLGSQPVIGLAQPLPRLFYSVNELTVAGKLSRAITVQQLAVPMAR